VKDPIEITGTLDIECASWDRFALGVCYDGTTHHHWWGADLGGGVVETPIGNAAIEGGGLDAMIDYLCARGGIWWAHAGGIYDFLAILERVRARGISCQIDKSASRITRIVIGKLQLRDSYALWPMPLDELAGAIGRSVPHLPWKCTCDKKTCTCGKCGGCGGFCRIGEKARDGDPDLLDYCESDCTILYHALHRLREFTRRSRISLRGTLGQTAWQNTRDELEIPPSDLPWHLWRAIRRGDKGGRTAVVRPYTRGGMISHHDICNAYPAQLARAELPVGSVRELGDKKAHTALGNLRPGLYNLTVHVPEDTFIPPLPWAHAGQIWFPVGEIAGTWTLPELAAALARGVEIVKIHTALVWEATAPIFGSLVHRWYDIRREVGRKSPLGQWMGRLAKAVTGKLAESPNRQRVLVNPDEIKVCLRMGPCRNGCTGRCGAYEQLDLFGKIYGVPYQHLGESAYPQWSAYLRSMTRIQWLEQAERFGPELCFGNTDSLWTLGRMKPEPLGDGLGQWEFQDVWCELDVRSPSVYAARELPAEATFEVDFSAPGGIAVHGTKPGRLVIRGVPGATEEDWKRGSGAIDRGVHTFGAAVKSVHPKGLFQARTRKWSLPERSEDRRIWGDRRIAEGGVTVPLHAREIRELAEIARRKRTERREGPLTGADKRKHRENRERGHRQRKAG